MIRLWELGGKLCQQEYRGHTDVVRDVQLASHETFLSAANDWWVTRLSVDALLGVLLLSGLIIIKMNVCYIYICIYHCEVVPGLFVYLNFS